jgi:hypothetical protein
MTDKSRNKRETQPHHDPRNEAPRRDHHDDEDTRIVFSSWDCALVPDSRG